MEHAQDSPTRFPKLTSVPLAVAYVAIPLGLAAQEFTGSFSTMPPFLPWLILAGIGCMWAMLFRRSGVPVKKRFMFEICMFLTLVAILTLYNQDVFNQLESISPYIHEGAPLIMLLFCFLWVRTFGQPDRGDFQRYGAILGTFCLIDLIVEISIFGAIPTIRFLGNTDILTGLLLVSLCAGLKPGDNDGGHFEPDQGHGLWRLLTIIGIAACLSRTGLFGAAWVFLCFGRGGKAVRIACSLFFLGLIGLTFFLPTTTTDSIRFVNYWLWVEAVRVFMENPHLLLTGFPIPYALPIDIPAGLGLVWETATGLPSLLGVYLMQIPSFWLRLVMGWGLGMPIILLIVLFVLLFRRLTRMGAGMTAALFAQGMTTPLLFNPAMCAVIGLGYCLALSRPKNQPNVRTAQFEDAEPPKTTGTNDPVQEWDMRPL